MGMLIHRHLIEMETIELPEEPIQEVETVEQNGEIPTDEPKTTARKTATRTRKTAPKKRTAN